MDDSNQCWLGIYNNVSFFSSLLRLYVYVCMAGTALMGIGQGKGKTRAVDAAMAAISSPLLDFPISKAKGIIFNIVGGSDMTLQEINR